MKKNQWLWIGGVAAVAVGGYLWMQSSQKAAANAATCTKVSLAGTPFQDASGKWRLPMNYTFSDGAVVNVPVAVGASDVSSPAAIAQVLSAVSPAAYGKTRAELAPVV